MDTVKASADEEEIATASSDSHRMAFMRLVEQTQEQPQPLDASQKLSILSFPILEIKLADPCNERDFGINLSSFGEGVNLPFDEDKGDPKYQIVSLGHDFVAGRRFWSMSKTRFCVFTTIWRHYLDTKDDLLVTITPTNYAYFTDYEKDLILKFVQTCDAKWPESRQTRQAPEEKLDMVAQHMRTFRTDVNGETMMEGQIRHTAPVFSMTPTLIRHDNMHKQLHAAPPSVRAHYENTKLPPTADDGSQLLGVYRAKFVLAVLKDSIPQQSGAAATAATIWCEDMKNLSAEDNFEITTRWPTTVRVVQKPHNRTICPIFESSVRLGDTVQINPITGAPKYVVIGLLDDRATLEPEAGGNPIQSRISDLFRPGIVECDGGMSCSLCGERLADSQFQHQVTFVTDEGGESHAEGLNVGSTLDMAPAPDGFSRDQRRAHKAVQDRHGASSSHGETHKSTHDRHMQRARTSFNEFQKPNAPRITEQVMDYALWLFKQRVTRVVSSSASGQCGAGHTRLTNPPLWLAAALMLSIQYHAIRKLPMRKPSLARSVTPGPRSSSVCSIQDDAQQRNGSASAPTVLGGEGGGRGGEGGGEIQPKGACSICGESFESIRRKNRRTNAISSHRNQCSSIISQCRAYGRATDLSNLDDKFDKFKFDEPITFFNVKRCEPKTFTQSNEYPWNLPPRFVNHRQPTHFVVQHYKEEETQCDTFLATAKQSRIGVVVVFDKTFTVDDKDKRSRLRFTKIQASVHLKTFKSCIDTKWPLYALFSEMRSSTTSKTQQGFDGFDMKTLIGVVTGEIAFSNLKERVDVNDLIKTKAKEYFSARLELQKKAELKKKTLTVWKEALALSKKALAFSRKRSASEPAPIDRRSLKRMKSPLPISGMRKDDIDEDDQDDQDDEIDEDDEVIDMAESTISFDDAVVKFVVTGRVRDGSNENRINIKAWKRLCEEEFFPEIHDAVVDEDDADFYILGSR